MWNSRGGWVAGLGVVLLAVVLAAAGCSSGGSSGGDGSSSGDSGGDSSSDSSGGGDGGGGDSDAGGGVDGGPVEVEPTLIDEQAIGPEGGTLRNVDNSVTIQIPAGALATTTTLRLEQLLPAAGKVDTVAGDAWVVPSRRYRLTPAVTTFAKPAWISVHMPASAMPFAATFHDIGIYRHEGGGWSLITMDPPYGILKSYPPELWCSGTTDRAGEFAARLHPPYDKAPKLVQIGAATAISTVDGPLLEVQANGVQSIWGQGFGWDPSKVEIQVGTQTFPAQSGLRVRAAAPLTRGRWAHGAPQGAPGSGLP
ncbi:MAG: hypothetical protein H6747_13035 [Deltaproteobacteria bacterium]|nr:hypothetical protein [Deltaproteobacteria bacterium]